MTGLVEPATIAIAQPILDRIARRVADAHVGYAPDDDADWRYGVDAAWLTRLRDYWRDAYDWRAAEASLNHHPQFRCVIDGIDIHFFRFSPAGGGYPLILTHGWPGSPLEFMAAAPLLAARGYDVIVPSLPGYAFSGRPPRPMPPSAVARLWRKLMVDVLGHRRFGAQGGDWGSAVTRWLGRDHADVVGAIHLNMMSLAPSPDASPEVRAWHGRLAAVLRREGAYASEHATKPQTIGLALADTPLGFAGWVIEKCRTWSDCGGDVEGLFGLDALITNVMTYLTTDSVQSAIWMYAAIGSEPFAPGPIAVPTGFAAFPGEFLPPPPRDSVERTVEIRRWNEMPRGGHFAAWEQPTLFAAEVAAFFDDYR